MLAVLEDEILGLNKQKGNMYPWVTHTWNPVKGKCPHNCVYCYMKVFPLKELRLDTKEFNTGLGCGNIIFVGSSCDMFADGIPDKWILQVLLYCHKFANTYLFQSKNPYRFNKYCFPEKTILGVTIESNRGYPSLSDAPSVKSRYRWMERYNMRKMVSIEPILDFDLAEFIHILRRVAPEFVSIGADSKGHGLPEPSKEKTLDLIRYLTKTNIKVKLKDNLKRIIGGS